MKRYYQYFLICVNNCIIHYIYGGKHLLPGRKCRISGELFLLSSGPHIFFELSICVFFQPWEDSVIEGFEQEQEFGTLWIVIALQDPLQLPLAAHSRIRKPCCIRPLLQLQSQFKGILLLHYTLLFWDFLCIWKCVFCGGIPYWAFISSLSLLPCSAAVEAPAAADTGRAGEPRDHAS